MNNEMTTLDQIDEEILNPTMSDEVIEAAEKDKGRPVATFGGTFRTPPCRCSFARQGSHVAAAVLGQ